MRTSPILLAALLAGCAGGASQSSPAAAPVTTTSTTSTTTGTSAAGDAGDAGAPTDTRTTYMMPNGSMLTLYQEPSRPELARVNAPADVVWQGLPGAYDRLGLKMTGMDAAARRLGTDNVKYHGHLGEQRLGRYLDCGAGNMGVNIADQYTVSMQVISQVRPAAADGSSEVATTIVATAKPEAVSGQMVNCQSLGVLEGEIARWSAMLGAGIGTGTH